MDSNENFDRSVFDKITTSNSQPITNEKSCISSVCEYIRLSRLSKEPSKLLNFIICFLILMLI